MVLAQGIPQGSFPPGRRSWDRTDRGRVPGAPRDGQHQQGRAEQLLVQKARLGKGRGGGFEALPVQDRQHLAMRGGLHQL